MSAVYGANAIDIDGQKRITNDLLFVSSSCDALMGLRLKWEAEANPRCGEKTAFRFSNEVYLFDGFLVLYHNQNEMPPKIPALEYTRHDIKCKITYIPEDIPSALLSLKGENDERQYIKPQESRALYLLQHYFFAQLLGIQPMHLYSRRDDLPFGHVDEVADFHIIPRFILVTNATVENMEALHDPRRIGFGSGSLLPLTRILEYLEMTSRFAATAFLAEFKPSQLIDCIVSTRVNGEPAAFRVDAVVKKGCSAKMEHEDQKDLNSELPKSSEDAESLPSIHLQHIGKGSDGSSKSKLITRWEEKGPFLQISPKVEKETHSLDPELCNLTGLRTDVFELGAAMPVILKHVRHCKLTFSLTKKFKSLPRDMALMLRACTHASFFDVGMQSVNTVEATIARVRMGHIFIPEATLKKRKFVEFDNDRDHTKQNHRQDSAAIKPCSQDRLAFLGNEVLKFLAASSLYTNTTDVYENHAEDLSIRVLDTTVKYIAESAGLDSILQSAFDLSTLKSKTKQSMLENCIKALIGAIYLESGIERCQAFLIEFSEKSNAEILRLAFTRVEKMINVVRNSSNSQLERSIESTYTDAFHQQFTTFTDVKIVRTSHWIQNIKNCWSNSEVTARSIKVMESLWIMHLGEAMIDMVVAVFLIHAFPCSKDELLPRVHSCATNNQERLATIRKAGFVHLLPLFPDDPEEEKDINVDILVRIFNATLGFLFLENDGSLAFVTQMLKRVMLDDVVAVIERREWQSPIQSFGRYLLSWDKLNRKRTRCTFKRLRINSADSHGRFAVALYVNDFMVARGRGISVSAAQEVACAKALCLFGLRRFDFKG